MTNQQLSQAFLEDDYNSLLQLSFQLKKKDMKIRICKGFFNIPHITIQRIVCKHLIITVKYISQYLR